jgi:predicted nucleotidyltransferase
MLYSLLIILISAPLAAMEPVQLRMEDEQPTERQPLLAPQPVTMNDQGKIGESRSILFNGSRRYYNHPSYKRVRNEAIKECLCGTLCSCLGMGCVGCLFGQSIAGCMYACGGTSKGFLFCFTTGGLCVEWGTTGAGAGFIGVPLLLGGPFACSASMEVANDPERLEWNNELKIFSDMLEAADPKKMIWLERNLLRNLVERASQKSINNDCALPFLRKLFACSYCAEKKVRNIISKRLQFKAIIPALLADKFQKECHLPKDVIKHLFKFIDFTEINKLSYVTEKELFYLLRDLARFQYNMPLPPVAYTYAKQLLLAQNGWLALTKSEQYPIRCEMKYFDINTVPQNAKRWYCPTEGPTIYLPFDSQLAKYYKFEDDPEYQAEHMDQTSKKIECLLQLRQEIVAHNRALLQQIPNNNMN